MNVTGNLVVFINERDYTNEKGVAMVRNDYCTTISKKDLDGEFQNAYMKVVFSNNLREAYKLDEFTKDNILSVEIVDAWLSCDVWYNSRDEKRTNIYIFVNDARIEEKLPEEEEPKKKATAKRPTKKPLKR